METNTLRLSFAFYENHDEYCLSKFAPEHIRETLNWLKTLCSLTFDDLRTDRRKYKFNEIDWKRTNEPQGFADQRIKDAEVYELIIGEVNNRAARMFGVVYENTYYIVWFDYTHAVTKAYVSTKKRG